MFTKLLVSRVLKLPSTMSSWPLFQAFKSTPKKVKIIIYDLLKSIKKQEVSTIKREIIRSQLTISDADCKIFKLFKTRVAMLLI